MKGLRCRYRGLKGPGWLSVKGGGQKRQLKMGEVEGARTYLIFNLKRQCKPSRIYFD